jgi:uncharacterized radical SAM protein YgiQ
MFLPTSKQEIQNLGWDACDIILISGDVYIDSPFIGIAIIGNYLTAKGFKVGVIAQPDIGTDDIARLGEPKLFWGVSAGSLDSFVANYTALNKFRNSDDLTPGGINNKRPDRACMVYTNLIRRHFKKTKPIVLGGLEASLRRIAHFDIKDNGIRRSILFDAKADILVYGMGEKTTLELARALKDDKDFRQIKGLCYIAKEKKDSCLELASFEDCQKDKDVFYDMFMSFYQNENSASPHDLIQKHADRYLVHNRRQDLLTQDELDEVYDMDFTREVHPYYQKMGEVKAQDTIKFSITTHRGCFGQCNFCSISLHQGAGVVSRSKKSIIAEAKKITGLKNFKGYITDLGGPTANMYGASCKIWGDKKCGVKRCLYPKVCENLIFGHNAQIDLLKDTALIKSVKKVFVSSGIRYDMICADKDCGAGYLKTILGSHISGQMKIAPEHIDGKVLSLMGKPPQEVLENFLEMFKELSKNQFLTYYFMAAYPGCDIESMRTLKKFIHKKLRLHPEQVQIFTPTPSTLATMMYWTKKDLSGAEIFVELDRNNKQKQKRIIVQ